MKKIAYVVLFVVGGCIGGSHCLADGGPPKKVDNPNGNKPAIRWFIQKTADQYSQMPIGEGGQQTALAATMLGRAYDDLNDKINLLEWRLDQANERLADAEWQFAVACREPNLDADSAPPILAKAVVPDAKPRIIDAKPLCPVTGKDCDCGCKDGKDCTCGKVIWCADADGSGDFGLWRGKDVFLGRLFASTGTFHSYDAKTNTLGLAAAIPAEAPAVGVASYGHACNGSKCVPYPIYVVRRAFYAVTRPAAVILGGCQGGCCGGRCGR